MSQIYAGTEKASLIWFCVSIVWSIITVIQMFLAYGTAYRCTKKGNDRGTGLFLYLIGFSLAALVPGLGLHYYIKHLQTKIIIQQPASQNVVRVVDTSQMQQMNMNPNMQVYSNCQNVQRQVLQGRDIPISNQNPIQVQYEKQSDDTRKSIIS